MPPPPDLRSWFLPRLALSLVGGYVVTALLASLLVRAIVGLGMRRADATMAGYLASGVVFVAVILLTMASRRLVVAVTGLVAVALGSAGLIAITSP